MSVPLTRPPLLVVATVKVAALPVPSPAVIVAYFSETLTAVNLPSASVTPTVTLVPVLLGVASRAAIAVEILLSTAVLIVEIAAPVNKEVAVAADKA